MEEGSCYANLQSKFLLSDILKESSEDPTHCDVVVKVQGGETFPTHSPILAAASPFFRRLLQDASGTEENFVFVMVGFQSEEVRMFLSSVYRQDIIQGFDGKLKYFDLESFIKVEHHNPEEFENTANTNKVEVEDKKDTYVDDLEDDDNLMSYEPDFGDNEMDSDENEQKSNQKETGMKNMKRHNPGVCTYCNKYYKHLKEHMISKHLDEGDTPSVMRKRVKTKFPFNCPDCGKAIIDRKFKLRHPCFKKSKKKMDLRMMKDTGGEGILEVGKTENGEEPIPEERFICHLCGINFPSKSSLTSHVKMKCGNVCELCKEVFASKTEVKAHMFRVHQQVTRMRDMDNTKLPEECHECGKRYSNKTVLGLHIKATHTKEGLEKVQCNDCGKFFSNKGALKKHSSLHRPPELPCPICGKLFHNNQYLLRHAMSAHGQNSDKKHKCEICQKGFDTLTTLEGHRNWHLNLKPFQCRWCERTYQNQPNASAHERKRHTEEYNALLTVQHRKIAVFSNTL